MQINIYNDGALIKFTNEEIRILNFENIRSYLGDQIYICKNKDDDTIIKEQYKLLSSLSLIIAINFSIEGTYLFEKFKNGNPISIREESKEYGICFIIENAYGEKLLERNLSLYDYTMECQRSLSASLTKDNPSIQRASAIENIDYVRSEHMKSGEIKVYGGATTLIALGEMLPQKEYISNIKGIYLMENKFYLLANCPDGTIEAKISPYYVMEHGEIYADKEKSMKILPLIIE